MERGRITFFLLLASLGATAQSIRYSYDAAGNRIRREIVIGQQSAPKQAQSLAYYTDHLSDGYRVNIHPNTSDGLIRVEVNATGGSCEGSLTAYSLSGAKVQTATIEDGKASIDLGSSPNGVYILHIEVGGKSTDWKIIKK